MDETTLTANVFAKDTAAPEKYEELEGDDTNDPIAEGTTTWDIYEEKEKFATIVGKIDADKASLAEEKEDVERVLCSQ